MSWRAPQSKREYIWTPPPGTPCADLGKDFLLKKLDGGKAEKLEIAQRNSNADQMSPAARQLHLDEVGRKERENLEHMAGLSKRDAKMPTLENMEEAEALKREAQYRYPEQHFPMRTACLYALKAVDGTVVHTPPAAHTDLDVDCWINDFSRAAIVQMGREVVRASGIVESEAARGEDSARSTGPSAPATAAAQSHQSGARTDTPKTTT